MQQFLGSAGNRVEFGFAQLGRQPFTAPPPGGVRGQGRLRPARASFQVLAAAFERGRWKRDDPADRFGSAGLVLGGCFEVKRSNLLDRLPLGWGSWQRLNGF